MGNTVTALLILGLALLPLPVEGISLADLQALTGAMLRCGATINEINAVRKHCSQIKGGQLARAAFPALLRCFFPGLEYRPQQQSSPCVPDRRRRPATGLDHLVSPLPGPACGRVTCSAASGRGRRPHHAAH